jgi:hypothetical protein
VKLLFCIECGDVLKLHTNIERVCQCGKSSGIYLPDGLWAIHYGPSRVIAIGNSDIRRGEGNWGFIQEGKHIAVTYEEALLLRKEELDRWQKEETDRLIKILGI